MKKNGTFRGKQRYQCLECGRQFENKRRPITHQRWLWNQYVWHRQTVNQLCDTLHRSSMWIRNQLDRAVVTKFLLHPQPVVVIADVTFWGRTYGVLVFRSFDLKQNLYWSEVSSETAHIYDEGRTILQGLGFTFDAVVIDGRRNVRAVFSDIPVQVCQFHQIASIRRYLTGRPKLQAGKELRLLSLALPRLTEMVFTQALMEWHARWDSFLKERSISPDTGRWFYTHRRIRSAYRSLKTNLPYLFTYQRYPELHIPNTTNSLDGSFSHLKDRLRLHRGLKQKRRWRLIQELLAS